MSSGDDGEYGVLVAAPPQPEVIDNYEYLIGRLEHIQTQLDWLCAQVHGMSEAAAAMMNGGMAGLLRGGRTK